MNINLTLIGQSITFVLFVWFCMKLVWPPIMAAMDERRKKIADGLAAAERGIREQELAQKGAAEVLREARQQAQEIIGQAQKRGGEIVDEAKQQARDEGERLVIAARAEIEQAVNHAREELRGQVANLAIAGATRVLRREVDAAANEDLLKDLVSQL